MSAHGSAESRPTGLHPEDDVPVVELDELRRMLELRVPVQVLDVRPTEERAEWSIPGSLHRDAYDALRAGNESALDGLPLTAAEPVVAVCARGRTSAIATAMLRRRGYDAFSLAGGMKSWSLAWNTAELTAPGAALVQVRRTGKGCLSYLLASGSEAVVVDASLDPEVYLGLAKDRHWTIRHVLDTHIHADHLSRSRTLAASAGATLWLPEQRRVRFSYQALRDGFELPIGAMTLRAISTPGHTLESMCFQTDTGWLLTGDTLFLAGVGRPDLEATAEESRARAAHLHRSLQGLLALDPRLLVLPAHTSAPVAFDGVPVAATLDEVREAVRLPSGEAEFMQHVLGRIPPTPPNHHTIVGCNESGELPAGDPTDLEAGANRCAIG